VRNNNGKLWLRFDDIDQSRCEHRYIDQTKRFLEYIGLDWDEQFSKQYNRINDYKSALDKLPHYHCDCSRKQILERAKSHFYDGYCKKRKLSSPRGDFAIRFENPKSNQEDFILWRKEAIPAYHLTSVVDDLRLGVNIIIRGEDLLDSSLAQNEIYNLLKDSNSSSWKIYHHQLILSDTGEKLSKSRKDGELFQLMQQNVSPKVILGQLAKRIGLDESKFQTMNDFLKLRLEDFSTELQLN
tara:strand:+ start:109428 stop:110150 length:723 start_codon:yes stop_codon:yes gene_type:complete